MASRRLVTSPPKVPRPPRRRVRTAASPYPPGSSWWSVKGRQTPVSRVYLLVSLTGPAPSGSTGTPRRCQGCSHPHRRLPDQAALSFTQPLRRPRVEGLSPPLDSKRLVAHMPLGPVVSHEQHIRLPQSTADIPRQRPGELRKLMIKCSCRRGLARHPISGYVSRPTRGARSVNRTASASCKRGLRPPGWCTTGP
jgi:hypothetical protein